jgi:hypothetical protein
MNVPAPNLSASGGSFGGGVDLFCLLGTRDTIPQAATVNWLHRHGTRILARVVEAEKKGGFWFPLGAYGPNVIRRRPSPSYVIVAGWMDPSTHQPYTRRSENLETPRNFVTCGSIAVRIDPQNPRRYLMDV